MYLNNFTIQQRYNSIFITTPQVIEINYEISANLLSELKSNRIYKAVAKKFSIKMELIDATALTLDENLNQKNISLSYNPVVSLFEFGLNINSFINEANDSIIYPQGVEYPPIGFDSLAFLKQTNSISINFNLWDFSAPSTRINYKLKIYSPEISEINFSFPLSFDVTNNQRSTSNIGTSENIFSDVTADEILAEDKNVSTATAILEKQKNAEIEKAHVAEIAKKEEEQKNLAESQKNFSMNVLYVVLGIIFLVGVLKYFRKG